MNSEKRREYILEFLGKSNNPQKGNNIAKKLGVTRQVIVKDIAILRAKGNEIMATPEGYIIPKQQKNVFRKILAFCHNSKDIEEELNIIVKFGGIIEDVIVEHPLYGEIKGMLMIKNFYDIQNFIKKLKKYKAEPLLVLKSGVHLHTIITENEKNMNMIIDELRRKNFLIDE